MAKETDRVATMADCLTHERGGSLGTIFRVHEDDRSTRSPGRLRYCRLPFR